VTLLNRMSTRRARVRESFGALGALTVLALLVGAAPAQALRTSVGTELYGVEPHSTTGYVEPTLAMSPHGGQVMHSTNTYAIYWDPTTEPFGQYDGDWKAIEGQYFSDVGKASEKLGNVFAVAAQYTDSTGRAANSSTFRGAYTDTSPYPMSENCTDPNPAAGGFACVTDTQVRAELSSFIAAHGLPVGLDKAYFVLTPPGVTVCTDGGTAAGHCSNSKPSDPVSYGHSFCSYHAAINPSSQTPTVYAVQPWTAGNLGMFLPSTTTLGTVTGVDCQAGSGTQQEPNQTQSGLDTDGDYDQGLADVIINELSVEQFAMMTDPTLNGWYTSTGNEAPDQCRNFFAPTLGGSANPPTPPDETKAGNLFNQNMGGGSYYVNMAFNQAALTHDFPGVPCIPGVSLLPLFTAPNPVNAGDIVGFDATESNVSLGATNYTWNFGDKSTGSGASVFHSFAYGPSHEVTLTVTDAGGNTASVTRTITVAGSTEPAPPLSPTPPLSPAPPATGKASLDSSSTAGSPGATTKSAPSPVATMSVVTRSLGKILRNGLVIRYSVNEQVTGRFEVLLDRSIARRLGITGATATGLPTGSAPSIVIAKAILVTTKGGSNTVKIQMSKRTATRLRKLHKVSLMLRLVVRNASSQGPASTTVLSTVTLTH
jgi:hypothetical protein